VMSISFAWRGAHYIPNQSIMGTVSGCRRANMLLFPLSIGSPRSVSTNTWRWTKPRTTAELRAQIQPAPR
jgi:hypothetical protein